MKLAIKDGGSLIDKGIKAFIDRKFFFYRGFSFEYSITDFLLIMVMRDHIQNQFTGVRSDGTVTQASLKAILSRILFCGFSF